MPGRLHLVDTRHAQPRQPEVGRMTKTFRGMARARPTR
jgi:hypothetical protein